MIAPRDPVAAAPDSNYFHHNRKFYWAPLIWTIPWETTFSTLPDSRWRPPPFSGTVLIISSYQHGRRGLEEAWGTIKIYEEEAFIQTVSTWPAKVFVVILFSETHLWVPPSQTFRDAIRKVAIAMSPRGTPNGGFLWWQHCNEARMFCLQGCLFFCGASSLRKLSWWPVCPQHPEPGWHREDT